LTLLLFFSHKFAHFETSVSLLVSSSFSIELLWSNTNSKFCLNKLISQEMAKSEASKAQSQRRQREKHASEAMKLAIQSEKAKQKKKSNPAAESSSIDIELVPTILAISDTEDNPASFNSGSKENPVLLSDDEIFSFHENEIDEIDQNNEVMRFIAALHDLPEDESLECSDQYLDLLWPVFRKFESTAENIPAKRILKSGTRCYQQPVLNPNSLGKKLVPRPLPRTTKHDRKVQREKAVGAHNNIMANWLIQKNEEPVLPVVNPGTVSVINPDVAIDPSLQPGVDNSTSTIGEENLENGLYDEVMLRLTSQQENYLSAIKETKITKSRYALAQWKELDSAIKSATSRIQERIKKDKKIIFPNSIIDNLIEFNNLRYKYILDGTKSPSLSAALATAQSSIRRRPSASIGPPELSSGIHLARIIARQAKYAVDFKHTLITTSGN
jgi:hypothetical protein